MGPTRPFAPPCTQPSQIALLYVQQSYHRNGAFLRASLTSVEVTVYFIVSYTNPIIHMFNGYQRARTWLRQRV